LSLEQTSSFIWIVGISCSHPGSIDSKRSIGLENFRICGADPLRLKGSIGVGQLGCNEFCLDPHFKSAASKNQRNGGGDDGNYQKNDHSSDDLHFPCEFKSRHILIRFGHFLFHLRVGCLSIVDCWSGWRGGFSPFVGVFLNWAEVIWVMDYFLEPSVLDLV
jgi:hypothetical protein